METKMDEWIEMCDVVLNSIVTKPQNRMNVARALWSYSHKNIEEAKYLLFEIFAEYLINPKINDIFTKIRKKDIGWGHPEMNEIRMRYKEFDDFLTSPPEVEEGVLECKKCGSKKTFSFSKQTRSADEATTVFVRCANCSAAFRL